MSYNVRLFDLYNWNENEKSKSEIFKLIEVENPDILCLQEYYFTNDENLPFETRNLILDSLGFTYYYESFSEESKENKFFGVGNKNYRVVACDIFNEKADKIIAEFGVPTEKFGIIAQPTSAFWENTDKSFI